MSTVHHISSNPPKFFDLPSLNYNFYKNYTLTISNILTISNVLTSYLQNNMIYNYKISCVFVLFCLFFLVVLFFFKLSFNCLNLGFSGHATIALVLWIHCFHLHVLTSDVVSLLPFLDSISLIIIVVQCRV